MSTTEAERFEQLRRAGFADVGSWWWGPHPPAARRQQELLDFLSNDPKTTKLKWDKGEICPSASRCSLCAASLGDCGIGDANAEVLAGHLKNNMHLTRLE
jgi:hypothetical protein